MKTLYLLLTTALFTSVCYGIKDPSKTKIQPTKVSFIVQPDNNPNIFRIPIYFMPNALITFFKDDEPVATYEYDALQQCVLPDNETDPKRVVHKEEGIVELANELGLDTSQLKEDDFTKKEQQWQKTHNTLLACTIL